MVFEGSSVASGSLSLCWANPSAGGGLHATLVLGSSGVAVARGGSRHDGALDPERHRAPRFRASSGRASAGALANAPRPHDPASANVPFSTEPLKKGRRSCSHLPARSRLCPSRCCLLHRGLRPRVRRRTRATARESSGWSPKTSPSSPGPRDRRGRSAGRRPAGRLVVACLVADRSGHGSRRGQPRVRVGPVTEKSRSARAQPQHCGADNSTLWEEA